MKAWLHDVVGEMVLEGGGVHGCRPSTTCPSVVNRSEALQPISPEFGIVDCEYLDPLGDSQPLCLQFSYPSRRL